MGLDDITRLIHLHNRLTSRRICMRECVTVKDRNPTKAGTLDGDFNCCSGR